MPTHVRAAPPQIAGVPAALTGITGFLVNSLGAQLRAATEARLADPPIRSRQVGLLLVLRNEGMLQQQVLGERLGMDRTTTMRLVGELETLGLVTRDPDPRDRRAYCVRLTAKGNQVAVRTEREVLAAQAEVLAPLTTSEARTLHQLLLKLLQRA